MSKRRFFKKKNHNVRTRRVFRDVRSIIEASVSNVKLESRLVRYVLENFSAVFFCFLSFLKKRFDFESQLRRFRRKRFVLNKVRSVFNRAVIGSFFLKCWSFFVKTRTEVFTVREFERNLEFRNI